MKTAMIIIDGMSDEPVLLGKTPMEAVHAPNISQIYRKGGYGTVDTCFKDLPVESAVCILGLLGYDPNIYYPGGRASFEALARGIAVYKNDMVLRCNIVSIDNRSFVLKDFTAGMIENKLAKEIVDNIKLPYKEWELYPGQGYRNLLVIRNAGISAAKLKCYEPHMHVGDKLLFPKDERLRDFTLNSIEQLKEINIPKADMLWLWSPSDSPALPSFYDRTGLTSGVICGSDFLRGIAFAAKMHCEFIETFTGFTDTDYELKGDMAIDYINKYDFTLVHINAADEAAHQRNPDEKKRAIENIDRFIIGPVLKRLKGESKFNLLICADHMTTSKSGRHTSIPVPYCHMSEKSNNKNSGNFTEYQCSIRSPLKSLDLLDFILKPR